MMRLITTIILLSYAISCDSKEVYVRLTNCPSDTIMIARYEHGNWILEAKSLVIDDRCNLTVSDEVNFCQLYINNNPIGLYLDSQVEHIVINNGTITIRDTINYLINSNLKSDSDILLINKQLEECKDSVLLTYWKVRIGQYKESDSPHLFINYLDKIPFATTWLTSYYEKGNENRIEKMLKVSNTIRNMKSLKTHYEFCLWYFERSSYSLCFFAKEMLNDKRVTWLTESSRSNYKDNCEWIWNNRMK